MHAVMRDKALKQLFWDAPADGSYLATNHITRFVFTKDGASIRVQVLAVCEDENGGQDYKFRTVAVYKIKDMKMAPLKKMAGYGKAKPAKAIPAKATTAKKVKPKSVK